MTKSTKNEIATTSEDALIDIAAQLQDGDTPAKLSMADTLRKHRDGYIAVVSSTGKSSLHNGDDIATLLASLSPRVALLAAQAVADRAGIDIDLQSKYLGCSWDADPKQYRLNLGQIRMNSANRLRGACKRGDETIATISAFVDAAKAELA